MIDQEHRIKYLIDSKTDKLVQAVMDDSHLPIVEAMAVVYNSRVFALLRNADTELYVQSPDYIYSNLQQELQNCQGTTK